jgi:uncharacterized protein involved in exopolysaccharide biosynthesis
MIRLIHFIARLYPRFWRDRYGAEFAALLEDVRPDGRTAANVLAGALAMKIRTWKSWRILAASAMFGAAVIAGLFIANPKVYRATAVLRVEEQGSKNEGTHPIQSIAQRVLSGDKLAEMITADGLYLHDRSRMPLNDVVEKMRKGILIARTSAAYFIIGFDYYDPLVAQRVTQDLASRFIEPHVNIGQPPSVRLQLLAPASLPRSPIPPSEPLIAALGIASFLFMGSALSARRRISARRRA